MLVTRQSFIWRGTLKPLCDSPIRAHRHWFRRVVCEYLDIQDFVINRAAVTVGGAPSFQSTQLIGGGDRQTHC